MDLYRVLRPSAVSAALNEQRLVRRCEKNHLTDTVEITSQELQRLRTMAHWALKP